MSADAAGCSGRLVVEVVEVVVQVVDVWHVVGVELLVEGVGHAASLLVGW
ncbi:MAG: hypothetical protein V9G04_13215 [Nocardioides sp.]